MEEKNMESMEREVSPQALESAQLLEELRDLRARELEWVFREDLDRIRRAFPQQAPDSIPELGDDFLKMRSLGIDAVTAFAAIRQARQPETPPPMGPADGQSDSDQDFFGPEEVRRMTPRQVEANLKKIERSQRHW
ncbi:MAG: hypothetical protein HFE80_03470 [Clostridiaceae bacterium]|jgi:hypothetical protein|nr:hypothetical protein [Clostridiaceae bacterium]